jgi:two-component system chemotaxis sensor kinase CheA
MSVVPAQLLTVFREEAEERLGLIADCLLAVEAGHAPPDAVDLLFRHAHSLKGGAGIVGFAQASAIAHRIEDVLEPARAEGTLAPDLVDSLLRATDDLRHAVSGEPGPASGPAPAPVPAATLSPAPQPEPPPTPTSAPAARLGPSVRVATEKVDRMLDAVGEAVIQHRRVEHLLGPRGTQADDRLEGEVDREASLLAELQDAVLDMRTLPLSSITGRFPRAVRDLALAEGKEVELSITGVETQLDRVLLDGLTDAITHLLRNAIAHGIEAPDQRVHAGKPRLAQLTLHAERRGDRVAIEVADDGRGVSPELYEEAQRHGSLVAVLAEAGFSTADHLSALAGRGVGLDAVKRQCESVGGRLEMESTPGQGMRATILLPVTLALFDALIVERAGQRFGIPIAGVIEAVAVGETASLMGRPSIEVRGESLPLGDLAHAIGAKPTNLPRAAQALVMGEPGARVAIACDRILGEQEVVVKSLGTMVAALPGYLGAAILGDGGIVLILDPAYIVRNAGRRTAATRMAASVPAPAPKRARQVLVVDDQFIVRELERSILTAAGYRVQTACHGREALDAITGGGNFDIVVTDLHMPELDGLGLLAAIRSDPIHATLPVVMVTSQGSAEDRRRGADAGADAYIVKDEFDQTTLLDTVDRLVGR